MGPITGWLIDRYGVRPLMFGGTLLVGIGYILLSRTSTYLSFVLVYLLVISIGASTSFMQATTASLNMWFVRKRGIVMGINSAAFQAGGRRACAAFVVRHTEIRMADRGVLGWGS